MSVEHPSFDTLFTLCPFTECADGEVRLVDGSSGLNGTVEVCVGEMWRTVCNVGWDDVDASVVCNQLGHSQCMYRYRE